MAKKPNAGAGGASKTFVLAVPVRTDAGETVTEVTLAEPEMHHEVKVARRKTATEAERAIILLAELSGLPENAVRRIKLRDARRMQTWLVEHAASGSRADALSEAADPDFDPLASPRAFDLLVPIATDSAAVSRLTVREPDIETGISVEKMDTIAEQTAAMIAVCANVPIPVVMRLKLRDVRRIERWLGFFFQDGDASPAAPAERAAAAADGATLPFG